MNIDEFDRMFAVEESHWWYRGRRSLVRDALDRYAPARRPLHLLDVACATGMSFRFLADYGEIRGIDISDETIRLCAQRGIDRIVKGDAVRLPFQAASFDVVLALDAFEHFDDDLAAMQETFRVLRPGGVLVATVPAFMSLWSPHDDAYHHRPDEHRRARGHEPQPAPTEDRDGEVSRHGVDDQGPHPAAAGEETTHAQHGGQGDQQQGDLSGQHEVRPGGHRPAPIAARPRRDCERT
jgi:SAM-dependent methyltransferase